MTKNRRADSVIFGFDFQVNAAIVLMLENIKDLESLKLEGDYEDIELKLKNNKYILAQAKAVKQSSKDFKNVRKNLEKALLTLSEGAQKVATVQLILITNSPNPLNERVLSNMFYGHAHRTYDTLPDSSKKLIDKYLNKIKKPLDTNKFMIQVLPFETDDDKERYKVIRQVIDDFIGDLDLNNIGINKKLLTIWQNEVFKNGSKKVIKLKKSDIVWSIISLIVDVGKIDDKFAEHFDSSLYEEIINKYKEIIDSCCERCETFIKILHDYQLFKTDKKEKDKCLDFVMTRWTDYKLEFKLEHADENVEEGLIQIILYNIIKNRIAIDRIKKGVNYDI
ncbi:hypothetical protein OCK72_08100 [Fusobacterium simiae]|uniref:CD-NTase associated protein 4-like DNA endonuclease domain-containing protein n=1 Tax=Fusobacterium simiae TaxID=855 RepID=A0ABT4DMT5_FUSSI|nr:hypothetical protein [Fusobacterium simiae]MCY7008599.1 hypothetical protein [Fusobacterium simiae]